MDASNSTPNSDPNSTAAAGAVSASAAPAVAAESLRAELVTARLEGAGIDASLLDLVAPLFPADQQPTKENMAAFVASLRKSKPALFGAVPAAQTAPTPARSVPSAPVPGASVTPFQQWQALEASGDRAASEAFYRLNRRDINRG